MARPHFARVEPIVGADLRRARVAMIGLPVGASVVTYLAACGLGRWIWAVSEGDQVDRLEAYLSAQHGPALELDAMALPPDEWAAAVCGAPPELVVAVGGMAERRAGLEAAKAARVPALLVAPPTASRPCQAWSVFPGDDTGDGASPRAYFGCLDGWAWVTAAPLCAGLARAMLLRHSPLRRADLEDLWVGGMRVMTLGDGDDPLAVRWSPAPARCREASRLFRTPVAQRGNLLIAGLGSLGSVAAMHLVPHAAGMVIADPDRVDAYNPVRQAYPLAAVGRPKAWALRDGLLAAGAQAVEAIEAALTDEGQVADLIARHGITAALVATGTAADFAIARALRACDVPHVVGRCYPRARYWEAILVDGARGLALSDVRGHLNLGPAPAPTPEQIAAYSDAGALEAEPATLIESGWGAIWMARLVAQSLAPPGLRERWMLELLAGERTCLVGGVGVERTADGPAYGIALPGMIRAWGPTEIN